MFTIKNCVLSILLLMIGCTALNENKNNLNDKEREALVQEQAIKPLFYLYKTLALYYIKHKHWPSNGDKYSNEYYQYLEIWSSEQFAEIEVKLKLLEHKAKFKVFPESQNSNKFVFIFFYPSTKPRVKFELNYEVIEASSSIKQSEVSQYETNIIENITKKLANKGLINHSPNRLENIDEEKILNVLLCVFFEVHYEACY